MREVGRLTPVAAVLFLAACVSVNKSVLMPGLAPVAFDEVRVYFEGDSIPEHTRVAILNASGSSGFTNEGQMIDKLREEAAKLGANAVILSGMKEPGAGEKFVNIWRAGWRMGSGEVGRLRFGCLRWRRGAGDRGR